MYVLLALIIPVLAWCDDQCPTYRNGIKLYIISLLMLYFYHVLHLGCG